MEGMMGGRLPEGIAEEEARERILGEVAEYCERFHARAAWRPGDRINYAGRVYDSAEMVNLVDSALEFWLTSGRWTERFEKGIASYVGARFASFVNSGSSANLLAFMTLTAPELGERAIGRGDEVITVACGFPTTVTPILQYGAVPVFVDVDMQGNIDVSQLDDALSSRSKAVMVAHALGNPFDLAAVKSFCEANGLWLIEDNCDALGSAVTIDGERRMTGSVGDIGTSSFYPPHHMTTGEGGAVYTSNPVLNRIARSFRDWGRDCVCPNGVDNRCGHRFDGQYGELPHGYDHKYVYSHLGYNLQATDMQAAVGCAQLEKFPSFVEARKRNWAFLRDALDGVDGLLLPEPLAGSEPSWFGFLMTCDGVDRECVVPAIEAAGVQTRMLFAGNLVKHPCFDAIRGTDAYRVVGEFANTERIMRDSFWIGVYPGMTEPMLDHMAQVVRGAVRDAR